MKAGHGTATIPVPDGSPMGGYVDRPSASTGVADPLEAHVVTVSDGARRMAFVVLDVVCVNVDLADAVERELIELGIDDVWVCATHTHSGPETGCVPGGAATPPPWTEVVTAAARRAGADAVAGEVTSTIGASLVSVTDVGSVRSKPGATRPVPVDVIAFRGPRDELTGLFAVLPVHPTVLPASSTVVSADLTGAVRRALTDRLGVWTVVATGAAGDISTRGVRQAADLGECARLGAVVADQVVRALPVDCTSGPVRTARADTVVLPTERGSAISAGGSTRQAETLRQAVRLRDHLPWPDRPLEATVRAARLGPVGLVGLPGEPFLDLRSRVNGILIGYVGGYLGYLPTRAAFAGEPTYETVISPIVAGAAESLVDVAAETLRRLR
ncbi:hypothetical protein [Labedaea rhizosphaerae]|uniref:Neutral/alkaline ceramidase-like enzyme n=1 Tax=Labedaea rhizosphaerae TaxID=598644 RepID=A0A4R6S6Z2_LABRH|nr:hypothetical protein [Labedaea rhizosphaerae]TDP94967.1 hypothetical protein EV186_105199 [Labedaea rhizosphaerae]